MDAMTCHWHGTLFRYGKTYPKRGTYIHHVLNKSRSPRYFLEFGIGVALSFLHIYGMKGKEDMENKTIFFVWLENYWGRKKLKGIGGKKKKKKKVILLYFFDIFVKISSSSAKISFVKINKVNGFFLGLSIHLTTHSKKQVFKFKNSSPLSLIKEKNSWNDIILQKHVLSLNY